MERSDSRWAGGRGERRDSSDGTSSDGREMAMQTRGSTTMMEDEDGMQEDDEIANEPTTEQTRLDARSLVVEGKPRMAQDSPGGGGGQVLAESESGVWSLGLGLGLASRGCQSKAGKRGRERERERVGYCWTADSICN